MNKEGLTYHYQDLLLQAKWEENSILFNLKRVKLKFREIRSSEVTE